MSTIDKKAYFNPAPWSDDVLNAYTQIKLVYEQKKRKAMAKAYRSNTPTTTEKKANFESIYENAFSGLVSGMEGGIQAAVANPAILMPTNKTLLLTAAAALASAKAPVWAGGPEDGEKKLSGKRTLRNVLLYNSVGRSVVDAPNRALQLSSAVAKNNTKGIILGTANLAPVAGLVAGGLYSKVKDKELSGRKALKGYTKGGLAAFAANFTNAVATLAKAGL